MNVDTEYVHQARLELEADLTTPEVELVHQEAARQHRLRQGIGGLGIAGLVCLVGFGIISGLNQTSTSSLDTASGDGPATEAAVSSTPSTVVEVGPAPVENGLIATPDGDAFVPGGLFTVTSPEPGETVGAYATLEIWTAEGRWEDVVALLIAAEHVGEPRIVPLGEPIGGEDVAYASATFQLPNDLEAGAYRVCLAPSGPSCGAFEI